MTADRACGWLIAALGIRQAFRWRARDVLLERLLWRSTTVPCGSIRAGPKTGDRDRAQGNGRQSAEALCHWRNRRSRAAHALLSRAMELVDCKTTPRLGALSCVARSSSVFRRTRVIAA